MKEVCMQVEDERRHADQFKEQVCVAMSVSLRGTYRCNRSPALYLLQLILPGIQRF